MDARRTSVSLCLLVLLAASHPHQPGIAANTKPTKQARQDRAFPTMPRLPPIFGTTQPPKASSFGRKQPTRPSYRQVPLLPLRKESLARRHKRPAKARTLAKKIRRYYGTFRRYRVLLETDKPLYKPGETVWARAVEVGVRDNKPPLQEGRAYFRLLDGKHRELKTKLVKVIAGHSAAQFRLPGTVGGEFFLQYVNTMTHIHASHSLQGEQYSTQRIRKTLRFLRRGLGPGELAMATFKRHFARGELHTPTPLTFELRLKQRAAKTGKLTTTTKQFQMTTNAAGEVVLHARLPKKNPAVSGSFVVKITRGGVTETLVRAIPLVGRKVALGLFPEGGQAVQGLPARVYFAARDPRTKTPIDMAGVVKNSQGKVVARATAFHHGMGRFIYTPRAGQRYHLHITRPKGHKTTYPLPTARRRGVSIMALDDFMSKRPGVHLHIYSQKPRNIFVIATQREALVGQSAWQLKAGKQRVSVQLRRKLRGILRLTVFDARSGKPLAERLIFRHIQRNLRIQYTLQRSVYPTRAQVTMTLRVKDPNGKPVRNASLGVVAVDDALLRQADSHTPGWLAQRFLVTNLLKGKLFRPNVYFDAKKPKAPRGLDLVMGTHGWRRFNWAVLAKPPKPRPAFDAVKAHKRWQALYKRTKKIPQVKWPKPTVLDWRRWFPTPAWRPLSGSKFKPLPAHLLDTDNDGVPDVKDACPNIPGEVRGRGCPRRGLVLLKRSRIQITEKIYFQRRSTKIRRSAHQILRAIAQVLKRFPAIKLMVSGHMDSREAGRRRHYLSKRRAQKVQRFLIRQGIAKARLTIKDFGPSRPLYPNRSAKGRARNRRVEFWVISGHGGSWSAMKRVPSPWWFHAKAARQFPTLFYNQKTRYTARNDRRRTLYWHPHLRTNKAGVAKVSFGLSDRISTFRVRISGLGGGYLGTTNAFFSTHKPLYLTTRWPKALSVGDALALPVTLHNASKRTQSVAITLRKSRHFAVEGTLPKQLSVKAGQRVTFFIPLRVKASYGRGHISVSLKAGHLKSTIARHIQIVTTGIPRTHQVAGMLLAKGTRTFSFTLPANMKHSGPIGNLHVYTGLISQIAESAKKLFRQPHGCFEQTSATNFPNTMMLQLLHLHNNPKVASQALQYLRHGAKRLLSFRVPTGGYSLYGRNPASLWLTAYGIFQFTEMKKVMPFPARHIRNAVHWLRKQRDPKGVYHPTSHWSRLSSPLVINAYIAFALAESGIRSLDKELTYLCKTPESSQDTYILALIVNVMGRVWGPTSPNTKKWAQILMAKQGVNGAFVGGKRSVVGSRGQDLEVQTTALAVLGLHRAGIPWKKLKSSLYWLQRRFHSGRFGSTQATVLGLKALIAYEQTHKRPPAGKSKLVASFNNKARLAAIELERNRSIAHKIVGWLPLLRPGKNTLVLKLQGAHDYPFAFRLRYFTRQPAQTARAPYHLHVRLTKARVKQGDVVGLSATLTNRKQREEWLPLVRIELPAGLRVAHGQLKALQARGLFQHYETRKRSIYLYLQRLKPKEVRRIAFNCVAEVTGHFISNASSAYPYYTPQYKAWSKPTQVKIVAP